MAFVTKLRLKDRAATLLVGLLLFEIMLDLFGGTVRGDVPLSLYAWATMASFLSGAAMGIAIGYTLIEQKKIERK